MEQREGLMQSVNEDRSSWLDRPLFSSKIVNWETILFVVILIVAVFTRLYILGTRVMSHDETSHVYFSWLFEQGRGYSHDPVTHGPLQFHLLALSYLLFGDNDFSARLPAALFSIATIAFMWNYRKLIGRAGALIAAALLLISPYILYYGRYARNEAFVALFGVVTIWAILRYLESGAPRYLFWLTAATAFHFTSKETSFIYTAQALIFLAIYLISRLARQPWAHPQLRSRFLIAVGAGNPIIGCWWRVDAQWSQYSGCSIIKRTPSPTAANALVSSPAGIPTLAIILLILGLISILFAAYLAIRGYTWPALRSERSFGALIVLGTLVLPMLAAFPVKFMGINPIDYNNPQSRLLTGVFVAVLSLVGIAVGFLWNRRLWLYNAALFYGIFIVFYTSLFTNGFGFITGMVGSLGYWLEQQGVNRGSQPWYYYGLIQLPVYEYLPLLGTLLTILLGSRLLRTTHPELVENPVVPDRKNPSAHQDPSNLRSETILNPRIRLHCLYFGV